MALELASDSDLAAVAALVNAAYRGDSARQGWTHEADFLDGERTTADALRAGLAAKPGARVLLLHDGPAGELLGCVWVEPAGGDAWYLGMLTVRPDAQDRRVGRALLAGAEAVARQEGARRMRMTVIGIRDTLIAWYRRRGYAPTGETQPFVDRGVPRPELGFVVLEKGI